MQTTSKLSTWGRHDLRPKFNPHMTRDSSSTLRLTVPYSSWAEAVRLDDLMFIYSVLADAKRTIAKGGTFVMSGMGAGDTVFRNQEQLAVFANRIASRT